ncbi:sensor histidine kinase [Actinophytocola algeriensis]|uniref:histidine kinase n=1 Tax=Actinophytocola algeriensis TaxID=1768010 RepID=A0A7W7Q4M1_9PSEU|nr:histidine kinase [Actinophytocola algeriensis]MBB4906879.1 signal transduction histidine kinase [Actinophytocola algeriensis]MBE1478360.1 signal transduction histidine kinase [Actinophytocola algeriensis]
MTPQPVPHRWLATLLGIALLLDFTMIVTGVSASGKSVLAIPGAAIFAACAWLGVHRPATASIVGAFTLTASSVLMRAVGVITPSIALSHIMLTELIAGTVLVVLVVWRTTPLVAFACTTALVVSCLASIVLRQRYCEYYCDPYENSFTVLITPSDVLQSLLLGFMLLVAAVSTGLYLRRTAKQRVETEMGALVRKQWPLGAALSALALIELSESGIDGMVAIAGAVGASVCAFFGPKYPLRNTWLAAGVQLFAALVSAMYGGNNGPPLSFTGLAASMALIAYVVRFVAPKQAAWATAGLSLAFVLAASVRYRSAITDANMVLILLFLLLVSVAAGVYFRARDRERNQTVKAAVTSAQQGERMALARELHDVVAHHVTGIVVQAQAAIMVAEKNPEVAVPALEKIERSGTEALKAMRTLVGSLRDGTAAWTAGNTDMAEQATTDLAGDLAGLAENFAGPPVELELDLPGELPHEVGRSVLRLVQESLTNVGKHAPDATSVRVLVAATTSDTLHIRVTDDGSQRPVHPAGGSGGYGLVGMRERVELLGGRFDAGPSGYVGWSVEAWLPLRKEGT